MAIVNDRTADPQHAVTLRTGQAVRHTPAVDMKLSRNRRATVS